MDAFVKDLQERVEHELKKIDLLDNAVQGYDHRVRIMHNAIIELKRYIATHTFPNYAAEIHCFKHVLPFFFSRYFYFGKVYNAEGKRITSGKENFRHFLEDELKRIEVRFIEYGDFCQYYYRGSEALDAQYYTRASWEIWGDQSQLPDENSSLGTYKASWIMADERYREYCMRELQEPVNEIHGKEPQRIEFKGSKSAAAELAIALTEARVLYFDDQPGSLVQVNEWVQHLFHIDLKDIHAIDKNNRKRKKLATPFLNMLIEKYNSRADRLLDQ